MVGDKDLQCPVEVVREMSRKYGGKSKVKVVPGEHIEFRRRQDIKECL